MKKLYLTILINLFAVLVSAQALNTVTFTYNPIVVFQDNVITVDILAHENISTGNSNHLYIAIDLASHATSGTDNQIIFVGTGVSIISNVAYVDLGTSTINGTATTSVSIQKQFTLRLNCGAIRTSGSMYDLLDDVSFTYGLNLLPNLDDSRWDFFQNPLPSPQATQSKTFRYTLNFPFIQNVQSPDVSVDYIDCYNSQNAPFTPIERTLIYTVKGAENSTDNFPFNLKYKFEDEYSCDISGSCNIVKVVARVIGVTTTPHITLNSTGSIVTAVFSDVVHKGDIIEIVETLEFPHYETDCVNECTPLHSGKMLNSKLSWGFDDLDENQIATENLCSKNENQNQVMRGSKVPHVYITRIAPTPAFPSSDPTNPNLTSYWDNTFTSGGSQIWKFRVENLATNPNTDDAVKNLPILITQQYTHSQFYYLRHSDVSFHSVPSSSGGAIFDAEDYIDILGPHPVCADNYISGTNGPLSSIQYHIPRLLPGEYLEVWLDMQYCCPAGDPVLFDIDKYLNCWSINAKGHEECSGDPEFANATRSDFANGIYGMEGTYGLSTNSSGKLYLKQDFSPAVTDLDAGSTCSGLQELHVDNYEFNLGPNGGYNLGNANIFTNTYCSSNSALMLLKGKIKFVVTTDNGLSLSTTASDFKFKFNDPTGLLWPPESIVASGSNCVGGVYTVTYNFEDFPSSPIIPNANTLPNIYAFLNNSSFYFKVFGCCCTTSIPNYTIDTYISGNGTCDIPMCRKSADMNIHCTGCNLPGMIVGNGTTPLERAPSSYGLEDGDNDGLANNSTPISATYISNNHPAQLNHSMVGDDLETHIDATLYNPASPNSVLDLRSHGADLVHLYLEEKIEHSSPSEFDVNILNVNVTIDQAGTIYSFTLNSGDLNIHDDRSAHDLYFIDLSRKVIRDYTGNQSFEFMGGEHFIVDARFHVCSNHIGSINSLSAADNKFDSKVSINMYMKANDVADDLVVLGIYNAFTDGLRLIAQEHYVVGSNSFDTHWLYYCETRSEHHYFYSVSPYIKSGIVDNTLGTTCKKNLYIDQEVIIGGELLNVFPYEYRPIPRISSTLINLPGPLGNYNISNASVSDSYSTVRVYNQGGGCSAASFHKANLNLALPFSSPMTLATQTATQNVNLLYPLSPGCDQDFANSVTALYNSDEYLHQHFEFPFTWSDCGTSATYSTQPNFVQTTFEIGSQTTPASCSNQWVLNSPAEDNHNYVSSPNPILSSDLINSQDITATSNCVQLLLKNEDIYQFVVHPFIYFRNPTPNYLTNVTIDGIAATLKNLSNGSQIWFAPIPDIAPGVSRHVPVCFDIVNCPSGDRTLSIFFGWNCSNTPTTQDFNANSICFQSHEDFLMHFKNAGSQIQLSPSGLTYSLCGPQSVTASLECLNGNLDNFTFKLLQYDHTLLINPALIEFKYIKPSTTPIPLPTVTMNYYNYVYTFAIPAQTGYSHLEPGEYIEMTIPFTPTQIWTGLPTSSPFAVDYDYRKYCGNHSDAHPLKMLDQYQHVAQPGECQLLNVQVSNSTTVCAGSSPITLTANVVGGSTGVSYAWTSNPGTFSSTNQNPTVTPIVTTAYTVVATNAAGYTGSATVIVHVYDGSQCCVPTGFNNTLDYDFSDISSSSLPYSIYQTSQIILINGVFTVNSNLTLNNCHNIVMGPGATINVLTGVTLEMNDCHVYSCSNMSYGIHANSHSLVKLFGTTIEDAMVGVNMETQSNLNSNTSWFRNDLIGVNIGAITGATTGSYQVGTYFSDTHFECTRQLVQEFPGQPLKARDNSYCGIRAQNTTFLDVGAGALVVQNTFEHLNFGIYGLRSNINVENCKFIAIQKYDPLYPRSFFLGTGIFTESHFTTYQLTEHGSNNPSDPDFINCKNGIIGELCGMDVSDNNILNCDVGIQSRLGTLATININNNTIDCNKTGISLLSDDQTISLAVTNNTIFAGPRQVAVDGTSSVAVGIDMQFNSASSNYSANTLINENAIHVNQYGSVGIHMNSVKGATVSQNYVTLDNDLHTDFMNGMLIENCTDNSISCNAVVGMRSDQSTRYDNEAAIRISTSRNNMISQNEVNFTSNGIVFHGQCSDMTLNLSTNFQKNTFGKHYYGLRNTSTAITDPQDHSGNQWLLPVFQPQMNAREENTLRINLDQYFVTWVGNLVPLTHTPGWFQPLNNFQDLISDPANCGQLPTQTGGGGIDKIIQIALDSLKSDDNEKDLLWQAQVALYEYLKSNEQFLLQSQTLADFYLANASTSIRYVAELNLERDSLYSNQSNTVNNIVNRSFTIYEKAMQMKACDSILSIPDISERTVDSLVIVYDQLMTSLDFLCMYNEVTVSSLDASVKYNIDLLSARNDSIEGDKIYESNEEVVNSIYFQTIASSSEDSLSNFDSYLYNIATQCPISGGPAVYRARTLLKMIYPDIMYDDGFTCIESGYMFRTSNGQMKSSKIFPNPTTGDFTLYYSIDAKAKLQIVDCIGRVCKQDFLNSTGISYSGTVSELENGLYFYRIVGEDGRIEDGGKIILEK